MSNTNVLTLLLDRYLAKLQVLGLKEADDHIVSYFSEGL